MLEGALIWDATNESGLQWYIGSNVDEVFNRLNSRLRHGEKPQFLSSIEDIISGKVVEDVREHGIGKHPSRARVLSIL